MRAWRGMIGDVWFLCPAVRFLTVWADATTLPLRSLCQKAQSAADWTNMAETPPDERPPDPAPAGDESPAGEKSPAGESQNELRAWHRVAGVGIEFVVAVLLAGGIGWWIDGRAGTTPWLTLVGLAFGFATGLYMMLRAARKLFHD